MDRPPFRPLVLLHLERILPALPPCHYENKFSVGLSLHVLVFLLLFLLFSPMNPSVHVLLQPFTHRAYDPTRN